MFSRSVIKLVRPAIPLEPHKATAVSPRHLAVDRRGRARDLVAQSGHAQTDRAAPSVECFRSGRIGQGSSHYRLSRKRKAWLYPRFQRNRKSYGPASTRRFRSSLMVEGRVCRSRHRELQSPDRCPS